MTFLQFDSVGLGSNFNTWDIEFKSFSVKDGILLMVNGTFWLYVLGIYLEAVTPKTYGQYVHPCFCLGCPWKRKKRSSVAAMEPSIDTSTREYLTGNKEFETKYLNQQCYEAAPPEIQLKDVQS